MRLGGRVSDIGHAIQQHVEAHGFSVVREFVGHGIGAALHEEPQIAELRRAGPRAAAGRGHGAGDRADGERRPAGGEGAGGRLDGGDRDGSLSAHFEHTVAVTKDGPLVLTRRERAGAAQQASATSSRCRRRTGDRADGGRGRRAVDGRRRRCSECCRSGLYRVEIERQRQVTAHAPGGPGRNFIRVLVGDRVQAGAVAARI